MKNNFVKEIIVSSVLLALTFLLLNPFHFWMPEMMVMVILVLMFIVFALFAIFVLREQTQDEREVTHKMISGRIAFLIGSALLTLGIIVESFNHNVDVWLAVALVAMILSKIITRIYSDSKW